MLRRAGSGRGLLGLRLRGLYNHHHSSVSLVSGRGSIGYVQRTLHDKPPRAKRQPKRSSGKNKREKTLQCKRQSPSNRTLPVPRPTNILRAIIQPERNHNPKRDCKLLQRNEGPPDFRRCELRTRTDCRVSTCVADKSYFRLVCLTDAVIDGGVMQIWYTYLYNGTAILSEPTPSPVTNRP